MHHTRAADPDVRNRLDARIYQHSRCTRQARACMGARILRLLPTVMHAYTMMHAPMGIVHVCCCQVHLQLGVLSPKELMLGVLLPQELMNTSGLHVKDLLQGKKADQED